MTVKEAPLQIGGRIQVGIDCGSDSDRKGCYKGRSRPFLYSRRMARQSR